MLSIQEQLSYVQPEYIEVAEMNKFLKELDNLVYIEDTDKLAEIKHSPKYNYYWLSDTENECNLLLTDILLEYNSKNGKWYYPKHYLICNIHDDRLPAERVNIPVAVAVRKLKSYARRYKESIDLSTNNKYDLENVHAQTLFYFNAKFNTGKWVNNCYGYDMNSCYPYFMQFPLPVGLPIYESKDERVVKDDEIGFDYVPANEPGHLVLELRLAGEFATIIFKAAKYASFCAFANDLYNLKLEAKKAQNKQEEIKYKGYLNSFIGQLKHHNIFIRCAIVGYAYRYINELLDDDTIQATVDSIYSAKLRNDLNIGENLGQFKLEYDNKSIRINGMNHQWQDEPSKFRGVPKQWLYLDSFGEYYYVGPLYRLENNQLIKNNNDRSKKYLWQESI